MKDALSDEVRENRKPGYEIHPIILNRWSSRALSGEEMTDDDLMPLFEAARWAPSSSNNQEWLFLYAKNNSGEWPIYFGLLSEGNQRWAKRAAVLVIVLSRKISDNGEKPIRTHSFDTGLASENLLLEGTRRGFIAHPIGGFDRDRAMSELNIPDVYNIECMIVIGKKGSKDMLEEKDRVREIPSQRKPLNDMIRKGMFG
ncbi:nitroreductase family protein [Candidatus Woesearchaeota archaeon]|nr:nitroreductase family protein [Candidatus Woesearchaeota archaeon]